MPQGTNNDNVRPRPGRNSGNLVPPQNSHNSRVFASNRPDNWRNVFNGNVILQKNHPAFQKNLESDSSGSSTSIAPEIRTIKTDVDADATTFAIQQSLPPPARSTSHGNTILKNEPYRTMSKEVENRSAVAVICPPDTNSSGFSGALVPLNEPTEWSLACESNNHFSLPVSAPYSPGMFRVSRPRKRRVLKFTQTTDNFTAVNKAEIRFPWLKELRMKIAGPQTEEQISEILVELNSNLQKDAPVAKSPAKSQQLRAWLMLTLSALHVRQLTSELPKMKLMPVLNLFLDLTCRMVPLTNETDEEGSPSVQQLVNETAALLFLILKKSTPHIYETILRSHEMATTKYTRFCKPFVQWAIAQPHNNDHPIEYYRTVLVYSLLLKYETDPAARNLLIQEAERPDALGKGQLKAIRLYAHTQAARYQFSGSAVTRYILLREKRDNLLHGFFKYHGLMKVDPLEIKCEPDEHVVITLDDDEPCTVQGLTDSPMRPLAITAGPSVGESSNDEPIIIVSEAPSEARRVADVTAPVAEPETARAASVPLPRHDSATPEPLATETAPVAQTETETVVGDNEPQAFAVEADIAVNPAEPMALVVPHEVLPMQPINLQMVSPARPTEPRNQDYAFPMEGDGSPDASHPTAQSSHYVNYGGDSRGRKRHHEADSFHQPPDKRQYDPPLNLITGHDDSRPEMHSFWENSVVEIVDLSSTECDLLSVDIQLEPLMSLFTDLRDSPSPTPPTTPSSKKGGSLEKQFRTPKFGFTGMELEKAPVKELVEPVSPEEPPLSAPSRRTRSKKKSLDESVEKCKQRLPAVNTSPKPPSEDIPPKPTPPPPVKRKRGRPRKKRA